MEEKDAHGRAPSTEDLFTSSDSELLNTTQEQRKGRVEGKDKL